MILKILSKKHVKEILKTIESHKSIYYGQLKKETGLNSGNLSKLLNELLDFGFITKEEVPTDTKIINVYYDLTEKGKEALKVYEIIDKLS
ncbi:transcriptional regulator [Methanococcus maripaludis]|uniref:DNA-binding HxlR family transcriptional regulator n=1 Tax=Methanococcus maripaludis TaxID=39152 RepID=A0A7J9PCP0_METMI|nr:transcriptional regulator [Methanococcus maripaludis]MBA2861023.1 DNA-binding HxlR family transcriptional regulator [Methanococcus maripaludis]